MSIPETLPWRDRFARACTTWLPGERWERWAFWSLMLLAGVLRFWDFRNIPYTHDELSALLRLFPTLAETIQKGVIEGDTHPPGVQVFEWLWTRAFGMSEAAVKFPFIVMGLVALFFLYRVASAWANTTVGLIVMALLATMQYTVLYGQIARPYAFGFFTCALLLDQLTRYVASGRRGALVGFVPAAVLSAYTHHFALLFAAVVAVGGFALLRREDRFAYAVACGGAALLYLPNLPVLLHQFSQGGLAEWLAPPGPYWLRDYAAWIMMYSGPLALVLLGIAALSIWNSVQRRLWKEPLPWLMLFWGLAPLAIGYAYSVWRAPVLQYSMLLFSFPCLLLAAFHGLPRLSLRTGIPTIALLTVLSIHGLVARRDHYHLFYAGKYEAFAEAASGAPGELVILDAQKGILDFYLQRTGTSSKPQYVLWSSIKSSGELIGSLADPEVESVVVGITPSTPAELPGLVHEYFPGPVTVHHYVEGSVFHFKRETSSERVAGLRELPLLAWSDSTAIEFGGMVEADVEDMILGKNDVIEVRASLSASPNDDIALIAELTDAGNSIHYRATQLKDTGPIHDGRASLIVAIPISDFELRGRRLRFKAYLHNRTGRWLGTPQVEVTVREGNPFVYGLYEPVGGR